MAPGYLKISLKTLFEAQNRTILSYIVVCGWVWGRIFFQKYFNIPLKAIPNRQLAYTWILRKKLLKSEIGPKTPPMEPLRAWFHSGAQQEKTIL